jgi:hypothetical protein
MVDKMKEGRLFYKGVSTSCFGLLTLKGSIQEKEINIIINVNHKENYINIDLANQLLIPEPNIIFFAMDNMKLRTCK